VVNPAGVKHKFEWDSRHRLTRVKNAANDVLLRYVYGDKDQVLERYDALANKTEFEYTIHLGRPLLTKLTTPLGRVTEWTRDGMGRVTAIEAPSGAEWQYAYVDDWSVVETITDPLTNETEYAYDSRLNEIKVTDPLGRETEIAYDDLNLPKEITDAMDQVTKLEWNANGDLKKLTDPRNKVYTMAWESSGRRKELQWPDAAKQSVTFDPEGKVITYQPRGTSATITNAWNAAGEITGQGWVNGTFSGTASLTRNAAGQLVGASTTAMTLTVSGSYTYDSEGRLATSSQTVGALTRTASITYDLQGRISTITYPAGFVVEYVRNADGQITAIKKDGTAIATYAYDAFGRLSTRTLSSGAVTTYGYDGMDRVNQIVVTSGTATLWAERYGYNAVGERIFTLSGTSGTIGDAYALDATSQLVGVKYGATGADAGYSAAASPASAASWTYDAAGNRQTEVTASGTTSYTVNLVNQYVASASLPMSYTTRGDLATRGDWEYSYDAFGNLIQAHNTTTNVLAKYWRDAFGHRAVKDVDGNKTVFFNLGYNQIEAYDLTAETSSSTIYESGIDRLLAEVRPDGAVLFYHQDWLGNVVMLTNNIGVEVQTYRYDVWGKASGFDAAGSPITTEAILSRFLFTGREYDPETGLYHYRARAYSGELGRFAQNDPIDFSAGDYNLYRYVPNNPIRYVDPMGTNILDTIKEWFKGPAKSPEKPMPDPTGWPEVVLPTGYTAACIAARTAYINCLKEQTSDPCNVDCSSAKEHMDRVCDAANKVNEAFQ
jgi:RHS repeat-associated protein